MVLQIDGEQQSASVPERVAVIGVTGSGKTAFAARLAHLLGIRHIELDAIHWGPDWTPMAREEFAARVDALVRDGTWVVDGNYYRKLGDIVLSRADTVVWLDYGLPVILWRLLRRTVGRLVRREVLWGKNRETFRGQFLSRDSLFVYAVSSRKRMHTRYEALFERGRNAGQAVVRLRTPRMGGAWLEALRESLERRATV